MAYLSAKRRKENEVRCPEDTRIAFSGGDYQAYDLFCSVLDTTHARYPDMALPHGGTSKGAEMIAAQWEDKAEQNSLVLGKRTVLCSNVSIAIASSAAVHPPSFPAATLHRVFEWHDMLVAAVVPYTKVVGDLFTRTLGSYRAEQIDRCLPLSAALSRRCGRALAS